MTKLVAYIQSFIASRQDSERGATMVEYGLMVALIAVFCIGAVTLLGTNVSGRFTQIANSIGV